MENVTAYCARSAPELRHTFFAHEMWALYEKGELRPDSMLTGEFTFDKPGLFEFMCSIAGHKDAGMKGTLTVVDASAPAAGAASSSHDMSSMPGMTTSTLAAPDSKPLPADVKSLPAPVVAPPITRTEPAYVKFDLETQKVVARMAAAC